MSDMVFSVDDIHRMRYEHYDKIKNLPPEQIIAATNAAAREVLGKMAALKAGGRGMTPPDMQKDDHQQSL